MEEKVCVAPSEILKRKGLEGDGLFAKRKLIRGTVVGKYKGTVLGEYDTMEGALQSEPLYPSDKLLVVRMSWKGGKKPRKGWIVVDGSTHKDVYPFLPMLNDPTGTRLSPNCILTEGGYLRVTAPSIPPLRHGCNSRRRGRSELRIHYGSSFWGTDLD